MMNQVSIPALAMTSREIAELTGKEHRNVLADVRAMLAELVLGELSFQQSYLNAQNKEQPMYSLPKDLTLTLVSGYSIVLRKRIIDRWLELETVVAAPVTPVPVINTPIALALSLVPLAVAAANAFGFIGNQGILSADKLISAHTGLSPLSLMGHTHLLADQRGLTFTPTQLGKDKGLSAMVINKLLEASGLQIKVDKEWVPTEIGLSHAEMLDTGKNHSNGTPVKQIKWFSSVKNTIFN
jgi:Rha family phage regulatory protein